MNDCGRSGFGSGLLSLIRRNRWRQLHAQIQGKLFAGVDVSSCEDLVVPTNVFAARQPIMVVPDPYAFTSMGVDVTNGIRQSDSHQDPTHQAKRTDEKNRSFLAHGTLPSQLIQLI